MSEICGTHEIYKLKSQLENDSYKILSFCSSGIDLNLKGQINDHNYSFMIIHRKCNNGFRLSLMNLISFRFILLVLLLNNHEY